MNLMQSFFTSGKSLFASIGGYTVGVVGVFNNEYTATFFGAAVGTCAGLWAIYKATQEPYESRLRQQRDEAIAEANEYRRQLGVERIDLAKARVHIAELEEESGEK